MKNLISLKKKTMVYQTERFLISGAVQKNPMMNWKGICIIMGSQYRYFNVINRNRFEGLSRDFYGKNGMLWTFKSPPNRLVCGQFDSSNVDPAHHCRQLKSPREIFDQFISPDIIAEIVRCTNI